MTILILAAGYATRLYPLTLDTPKPLLKVGPKPIIEHIFDKISELEEEGACFIVTNEKFFRSFKEWAGRFEFERPIEVISDGTTTNENRLGAIRDIEFVINKKGIKDDLLVMGGDNLFGFSLRRFVEFAKSHKPQGSLAVFDIKEKEKAKIYGVVKADESGKVVSFEEKPARPQSTLISTCVYYFPANTLGLITRFLSSGNKSDAPGNYIRWISGTDGVYAFAFKEQWYDIGDMKSYEEANKKYGKA